MTSHEHPFPLWPRLGIREEGGWERLTQVFQFSRTDWFAIKVGDRYYFVENWRPEKR